MSAKKFLAILLVVLLAFPFFTGCRKVEEENPCGEIKTVKVYFSRVENNEAVFYPFERKIVVENDSYSLPYLALEALLMGPNQKELKEGFFTTINPNVKINYLKIENGVAYPDFDEQLQFQVGGSMRVLAIRDQIERTLKEFPEIERVVISINGESEAILQP